jgi:uncharacterized Zn-finger protein
MGARKPNVGVNDLATINPELAAQAHGWDPTTLRINSIEVVLWKCDKNHVWESTVHNRTAGHNCPYCSGRRAISGENDLATMHPDIAAQANGWDPTQILPYSNVRKQWHCDKGHLWLASSSTRVFCKLNSGGNGCPYCSGRYVLTGFNDLATLYPEIAAEAHGWDATLTSGYTNKKLDWICGSGHVYCTRVGHRTYYGSGCPYCSNQKVLPGFNDLLTVDPGLAAQVYEGDPSMVTVSSGKRFKWICGYGHIWSSRVADRTAGKGCSGCAIRGFNTEKPGYLYLLRHDLWGMLQIGITNLPQRRMNKHAELGWEIVEIRGPMNGNTVRRDEKEILRFLHRNGADVGNAGIAGKFDGYTECWVEETYPVKSLQELLNAVGELVSD